MKIWLSVSGRHLQAGFTLLEILVAVSLVVVVSTLAFMGLDALVQAQAQTDQAAYRWRQDARTWQLMRQDVRFAIPRSSRDERGQSHAAFVGQARQFQLMRLTSTSTDAMSVSVHKVRWQWRANALWRGVKVPPEARAPQWRERMVLFDDAPSRFEYQDNRGRWHAQWPPAGIVPAADAGHWPAANLPRAVRWLRRENGQERMVKLFPLAEENAGFP